MIYFNREIRGKFNNKNILVNLIFFNDILKKKKYLVSDKIRKEIVN